MDAGEVDRILKTVREHWDNHIIGTHWEGCEAAHYSCMILKLASCIESLLRGEFICRKCGIRKNAEHDPTDSEF